MNPRAQTWLLLLIATAWAAVAAAARPTDLPGEFEAANQLYEQGRFTEAAAAYETLLHSGAGSAAVRFNLGNAYYKSGQVGRALAAYRSAARATPRDPDLRANLRFVRNQVQGVTAPPGRGQRWLGGLTVNEWTMLAAVCFWLWLLVLTTMQLRPAWKPWLRPLTLPAGIVTAAIAGCLAAAFITQSAPTAIVITREAVIRNGPLEESPALPVSVRDGAELRVLDRKNDWVQVGAGSRRLGWLKRDQVLVENDPAAL